MGKERLYWKKRFIERKALLEERLYWKKGFVEIHCEILIVNLVKLLNYEIWLELWIGQEMWIWSPLWNLVGIVNLVNNCELWTVLKVMVTFLVCLVYSFIWFGMVGRGYVMNVSRSYVMTVGRVYVIQVIWRILRLFCKPWRVLKAIWLDPEGYFVSKRVISNPQGYISGLGYLSGSLRLYEGFKECQV